MWPVTIGVAVIIAMLLRTSFALSAEFDERFSVDSPPPPSFLSALAAVPTSTTFGTTFSWARALQPFALNRSAPLRLSFPVSNGAVELAAGLRPTNTAGFTCNPECTSLSPAIFGYYNGKPIFFIGVAGPLPSIIPGNQIKWVVQAGTTFAIKSDIHLFAQYDHTSYGKSESDTLSVGLIWRFPPNWPWPWPK